MFPERVWGQEARGRGRLVRVPAGSEVLEGNLDKPEGAGGIVLFAGPSDGTQRRATR